MKIHAIEVYDDTHPSTSRLLFTTTESGNQYISINLSHENAKELLSDLEYAVKDFLLHKINTDS